MNGNEFFAVVRDRRSVRKFSGREVPRADIAACLEAARLAPSGSNAQPWRWLVVRGAERRANLAEAGYNQPCLVSAPVLAVLIGDRGVYRKRLRRAKELADSGALSPDTLAILEGKYRRSGEARDANDKTIFANCMLAGEHYALAAAAIGLGTCWVMLFDAAKVMAVLGLDEKDHFPVALFPTGFPAEIAPARPRYGLSDIAWDENCGTPWA